MMKAIIVEDDPKHCKTLEHQLHYAKIKVSVATVVGSVADAEIAIKIHRPDLVFLDIDLEAGDNGFDLLRRFDQPDFAVIFTTQHNNADNAIAAIRACALEFLPKPILLSELDNALIRYNHSESVRQVQSLRNNIADENNEWVTTIWIATTEGKIKLDVDNISYCKSDNSYTNFHLRQSINKKSQQLSSQPIKYWEHSLSKSYLMRVHNEFLVNLKHVEKYKAKLSGSAILSLNNGIEIPVSKSRKNEVRSRLDVCQKR